MLVRILIEASNDTSADTDLAALKLGDGKLLDRFIKSELGQALLKFLLGQLTK